MFFKCVFVRVQDDCIEARDGVCIKRLACGHACQGVKGETECLPCLNPQCAASDRKQDLDDLCNVCSVYNLSAMPTVLLKCGHAFHFGCMQELLRHRWNGPRITFGFSQCPLCKADIEHPLLEPLTAPIRELFQQVQTKALLRLKFENLDTSPEITVPGAPYYNDPAGFAMHKFAYYQCFKCAKPYFGGAYECAAAGNQNFDPSELMCGSCSPSSAKDCPKHGREFLEFKCRFCCSVAVWFCFGTTHFCEPCHNNHSTLTSKDDHPACPCLPKNGRDLPKSLLPDVKVCPLGLEHPPTGTEFALGCGLCRNQRTF